MENFQKYLKQEQDTRKTLQKIPTPHKEIAEKFKVKFETGHTLKDDPKHVGRVFLKGKKEIALASPYYWSKEFVYLHEIGHLIYDNIIKGTPLEKEWEEIVVQNNKRNPKDSNEECFAHAYAGVYSKYPPAIYVNPYWSKFIRKLS